MKTDVKIVIGVIVGTIVLFGGLLWLMSNSQTPQNLENELLIGTNPHEKGASSEEAVLTIVEFSDFQCPACRATQPFLSQFVEENKDNVRLIYRHFPLVTLHVNAQTAAIASEVAAEMGKFWEYHDILFENQTKWAEEPAPQNLFVQFAGEIGLDETVFRDSLAEEIYSGRVREDASFADELNLNSTPSIFFNGTLHKGIPSPDQMATYLQEATN